VTTSPVFRPTPATNIALGDVVCYLPTGWYYKVVGAEGGDFLLGDAPMVKPWVSASKLHRAAQ